MSYKIFLSPPNMYGKEIENVNEAFASNYVAPTGTFITEFERKIAEYTGVSHSLAVISGTASMHLLFRFLGIGEGDFVFCSDFTFMGSCNPIFYERAIPVFIDSEPNTWNMSPISLEKAFVWAKAKGKIPKAVIIVDLYGESADYDSLLPICQNYGAPVIEDAAEALGTTYRGKKCGSFGDYSIFSFNGNKIITTSGGGMVLSNNKDAIDKMRFWATQAREPVSHYEHKEYGYNYRLSNICAAIGCGQLDFINEKIKRRKDIYERYIYELDNNLVEIKQHYFNSANNWLTLLYLKTDKITPYMIVNALAKVGIETRPAWKPMHMQPVFTGTKFFSHYEDRAVDENVFARAICLPSGDGMTDDEIEEVITQVKKCLI